MLYYIASQAYQQIIAQACLETEQIVTGSECGEDVYLLPIVKDNYQLFAGTEIIIIDLFGIKDSDDEIIAALDQLRLINSNAKIIIVAAGYKTGDALLSKCFQMSIYDIIINSDYVELKDEIAYSIKTGKQYRDSIMFKDVIDFDKIKLQPKIIDHVSIGIIGTQSRIGVTHHAITLATALRHAGYMVCVNNMTGSDAYEHIANSFGIQPAVQGMSWRQNGIDFYHHADEILEKKAYNFVIIDYGYSLMNFDRYLDCNHMICIAGVKPWEDFYIQEIFKQCAESGQINKLNEIMFCFNFCPSNQEKDVYAGMDELSDHTYFLNYQEDPWVKGNIPYLNVLLEKYNPENHMTDKKKKRRPKKNA